MAASAFVLLALFPLYAYVCPASRGPTLTPILELSRTVCSASSVFPSFGVRRRKDPGDFRGLGLVNHIRQLGYRLHDCCHQLLCHCQSEEVTPKKKQLHCYCVRTDADRIGNFARDATLRLQHWAEQVSKLSSTSAQSSRDRSHTNTTQKTSKDVDIVQKKTLSRNQGRNTCRWLSEDTMRFHAKHIADRRSNVTCRGNSWQERLASNLSAAVF